MGRRNYFVVIHVLLRGRRNYFVMFHGVSGFMADYVPEPENRACRECLLKSGGPGNEGKEHGRRMNPRTSKIEHAVRIC